MRQRGGRARLAALAFGCAAAGCIGSVAPPAGTGSAGTTGAGVAGSSAGTGSNGNGGNGGSTGSGGATGGSVAPGTGGSGAPAGAAGQIVAGTGGNASAGTTGQGQGGRAGTGQGGASATGTAGAAGSAAASRDHCVYGYEADPRDAQIKSNYDQWKATNGDVDLVVPKGVLDWMTERVWEKSHDAWHNIRRCRTSAAPGGGGVNVCAHTELVPDHQECADAEDGYEFLVMHRHMMQSLRQAFPQHAAVFDGFPKFPFNATDVPQEWQGRWGTGWSQQILDVAKVLEDIENKLSMFATEGDLGKYIQCGGMSNGASSIHGALHFKWVVASSPHSLGTQAVNIDNYMFWKLHGWIDKIWERYRVAKGIAPTEAKLKDAMQTQCVEMHQLGLLFDPSIGTMPDAPLPVEHGYFHETVRPILESATNLCGTSCHGAGSPEANMVLGGHVSSADIVKNLVNVATAHGGQFKRIVPNNPNQSWLYLKITDMAKSAGCTGTMCNTQVMPPTGSVTVTKADADVIKNWINMGAPAPTQ